MFYSNNSNWIQEHLHLYFLWFLLFFKIKKIVLIIRTHLLTTFFISVSNLETFPQVNGYAYDGSM